jgi:hypothetical protein
MEKAFSMAEAEAESERPGRSGVTTPIAPAKRRTGMTGALFVHDAGR